MVAGLTVPGLTGSRDSRFGGHGCGAGLTDSAGGWGRGCGMGCAPQCPRHRCSGLAGGKERATVVIDWTGTNADHIQTWLSSRRSHRLRTPWSRSAHAAPSVKLHSRQGNFHFPKGQDGLRGEVGGTRPHSWSAQPGWDAGPRPSPLCSSGSGWPRWTLHSVWEAKGS